MNQNKTPMVSVIIPVYNREYCIRETLDNLFNNYYRPLELVLVNDGSKDQSLSLLKKFKAEHESADFHVIVLDQPNKGAPAARNLGYENSSGKYIQFLDSDDLIKPDKFSIQVGLMEKEGADFGLCDFEMIYTNGDDRIIYCSNAQQLRKVLSARGTFGCGSPLLRRDLADNLRWNTQLRRHQDVDFFLRAALLAKRFAYTGHALYSYIHHGKERISDIYAITDPAYKLRIKSLEQLFRHRYNWHYITIAICNLYWALIKYNTKKRLALR